MVPIKIAVSATSEDPELQARVESVTHDALRSLGSVKVVEGNRWDYLLRYSVALKPEGLVEIHVKYSWRRRIHQTLAEEGN